MSDYLELRNKALFGIENPKSGDILINNPYLVYHPPVNPLGTNQHFTIFNENSAVCCTEHEAMLLNEIVWAINPKLMIEIGSYAGWSTVHILQALDDDALLLCVDNFSECEKPELVKEVLTSQIQKYSNCFLFEQDSTEFLKSLVSPKADVIFIDGFHRNGKPLEDVIAATQALKPDGYIILHDTWMPDVNVACNWLVNEGYQCYTFNTDNQLEVYTKGDLKFISAML